MLHCGVYRVQGALVIQKICYILDSSWHVWAQNPGTQQWISHLCLEWEVTSCSTVTEASLSGCFSFDMGLWICLPRCQPYTHLTLLWSSLTWPVKIWFRKREKSGSDRSSHGRRECDKCEGIKRCDRYTWSRGRKWSVVWDEAGETGRGKTTRALRGHDVNFYFLLEATKNH